MAEITHAQNPDIPEGYLDTNIALTCRILSGMLTGRNVFGQSWTARFAHVPEGDVPPRAKVPVITKDLGAGDDICAMLLPPEILGDLTEVEAIDGIRDGRWPIELLDQTTQKLKRLEVIEEVYGRCDKLMLSADRTTFYWDANYIAHTLAVQHLDDAAVVHAVKLFEKYSPHDIALGMFGLFLIAFLGPTRFNELADSLRESFAPQFSSLL
jgi:hypothetical protein